ncbi:hypothetical protein PPERSA_04200 [Pseudocohnilembus persalinus]|uniref:Uncharacterized protein n=1 Tax=Pseudocohnilembus persalinus TaxID=266149 RepID=A0A0V0QNU4_PSEPJ|nr:hypothetical protein PPERSA_04200 [Pseudocohnilembus persalinus]|eukprot:KRX03648.1 hypothetical protein PPERSA_04200 [Pseudocohnilembus persalinus]
MKNSEQIQIYQLNPQKETHTQRQNKQIQKHNTAKKDQNSQNQLYLNQSYNKDQYGLKDGKKQQADEHFSLSKNKIQKDKTLNKSKSSFYNTLNGILDENQNKIVSSTSYEQISYYKNKNYGQILSNEKLKQQQNSNDIKFDKKTNYSQKSKDINMVGYIGNTQALKQLLSEKKKEIPIQSINQLKENISNIKDFNSENKNEQKNNKKKYSEDQNQCISILDEQNSSNMKENQLSQQQMRQQLTSDDFNKNQKTATQQQNISNMLEQDQLLGEMISFYNKSMSTRNSHKNQQIRQKKDMSSSYQSQNSKKSLNIENNILTNYRRMQKNFQDGLFSSSHKQMNKSAQYMHRAETLNLQKNQNQEHNSVFNNQTNLKHYNTQESLSKNKFGLNQAISNSKNLIKSIDESLKQQDILEQQQNTDFTDYDQVQKNEVQIKETSTVQMQAQQEKDIYADQQQSQEDQFEKITLGSQNTKNKYPNSRLDNRHLERQNSQQMYNSINLERQNSDSVRSLIQEDQVKSNSNKIKDLKQIFQQNFIQQNQQKTSYFQMNSSANLYKKKRQDAKKFSKRNTMENIEDKQNFILQQEQNKNFEGKCVTPLGQQSKFCPFPSQDNNLIKKDSLDLRYFTPNQAKQNNFKLNQFASGIKQDNFCDSIQLQDSIQLKQLDSQRQIESLDQKNFDIQNCKEQKENLSKQSSRQNSIIAQNKSISIDYQQQLKQKSQNSIGIISPQQQINEQIDIFSPVKHQGQYQEKAGIQSKARDFHSKNINISLEKGNFDKIIQEKINQKTYETQQNRIDKEQKQNLNISGNKSQKKNHNKLELNKKTSKTYRGESAKQQQKCQRVSYTNRQMSHQYEQQKNQKNSRNQNLNLNQNQQNSVTRSGQKYQRKGSESINSKFEKTIQKQGKNLLIFFQLLNQYYINKPNLTLQEIKRQQELKQQIHGMHGQQSKFLDLHKKTFKEILKQSGKKLGCLDLQTQYNKNKEKYQQKKDQYQKQKNDNLENILGELYEVESQSGQKSGSKQKKYQKNYENKENNQFTIQDENISPIPQKSNGKSDKKYFDTSISQFDKIETEASYQKQNINQQQNINQKQQGKKQCEEYNIKQDQPYQYKNQIAFNIYNQCKQNEVKKKEKKQSELNGINIWNKRDSLNVLGKFQQSQLDQSKQKMKQNTGNERLEQQKKQEQIQEQINQNLLKALQLSEKQIQAKTQSLYIQDKNQQIKQKSQNLQKNQSDIKQIAKNYQMQSENERQQQQKLEKQIQQKQMDEKRMQLKILIEQRKQNYKQTQIDMLAQELLKSTMSEYELNKILQMIQNQEAPQKMQDKNNNINLNNSKNNNNNSKEINQIAISPTSYLSSNENTTTSQKKISIRKESDKSVPKINLLKIDLEQINNQTQIQNREKQGFNQNQQISEGIEKDGKQKEQLKKQKQLEQQQQKQYEEQEQQEQEEEYGTIRIVQREQHSPKNLYKIQRHEEEFASLNQPLQMAISQSKISSQQNSIIIQEIVQEQHNFSQDSGIRFSQYYNDYDEESDFEQNLTPSVRKSIKIKINEERRKNTINLVDQNPKNQNLMPYQNVGNLKEYMYKNSQNNSFQGGEQQSTKKSQKSNNKNKNFESILNQFIDLEEK